MQRALMALATLRKSGWFDKEHDAPWLTYPAVRFLDGLDTSQRRALEFGSGASTAWLNARFDDVLSIEHAAEWYAKSAGFPIVLRDPDGGPYHGAADSPYLEAGRVGAPWDVVLVDGMARVTCVEHIDDFVAADGLVVLDDTDLPELQPARESLIRDGFAAIDFWGFKPWLGIETCTSVYSRDFGKWLSSDQVQPLT